MRASLKKLLSIRALNLCGFLDFSLAGGQISDYVTLRLLISTAFLKESSIAQYACPTMNQLIHLLICPICNRTLDAPTTLQCGHSICSHHSTVCCPQNPLPPAPNIPAQSRVTFNPAPHAPLATLSLTRTPDVTLTSILALVQRQNEDGDDRPRKRRRRHQSPDDDDDDGGDGDLLTHLRNSAAHQRSIPHDVPLIQNSPPPNLDDDDDDNGDGDLLTHLRNAAAHQRSVPIDVPLIQDSPLPDFDKRLLEELTCHICYVLFYKPVTTPCQHVRTLLTFFKS